MKKMTDEQRAKMEAFAKQMGHPLLKGSVAGESAAEKQRMVRETAKAQEAARIMRYAQEAARARTMVSQAAEKAEAQDAADGIRKTKPNKYENMFMIDLMILRNTLGVRREKVRARLTQVNPYAWRDLQLLYSLVCRIQDQLIRTMPDSRDEYYRVLAEHGQYHLEIEGPLRPTRQVLIGDRNLGALCDAAMESECLTCLRTGNEIDRCLIRRALLEVAPPAEVIENGIGCEYREVPGQLIRGEMVTV